LGLVIQRQQVIFERIETDDAVYRVPQGQPEVIHFMHPGADLAQCQRTHDAFPQCDLLTGFDATTADACDRCHQVRSVLIAARG